MRGRRPCFGLLSVALIIVGVIILLAMLLPAGFWWFILGAGMVFLGLVFAGRRR